MNQKTLKMIRRYAKLRGKTTPGINEQTLRTVYEHASPEAQFYYKTEMKDYFEAIDQGRIQAGDSILMAVIPKLNDDLPAEDNQHTKADT